MTRLKISIAILLTLLGLCAGSAYMVHRQCSTLLDALHQVEQAKGQAAIVQCDRFLEEWTAQRDSLLYLVRKDRVTEVEAAIVRLRPMLEDGCDEFTAELASVEAQLYRLMEGELPLLSSLF